jgi:hypothetical protein
LEKKNIFCNFAAGNVNGVLYKQYSLTPRDIRDTGIYVWKSKTVER